MVPKVSHADQFDGESEGRQRQGHESGAHTSAEGSRDLSPACGLVRGVSERSRRSLWPAASPYSGCIRRERATRRARADEKAAEQGEAVPEARRRAQGRQTDQRLSSVRSPTSIMPTNDLLQNALESIENGVEDYSTKKPK